MAVFKSTMKASKAHGFALLSAVWIAAILSLLSITGLQIYLRNTDQSSLEIKKLNSKLMHDAALNYAVLDILEPRKKIVANAIPNSILSYQHPNSEITIEIRNESGFVSLNKADKKFIQALLKAKRINPNSVSIATQRLAKFSKTKLHKSHRKLRAVFSDYPEIYSVFQQYGSLFNQHSSINPRLASATVLSLVPDLSNAERQRLTKELANDQQKRLFSSPIDNQYLANHISSFYRVTSHFSLGDFSSKRTDIIKITPDETTLYKRVAQL